MTDKGDGYRLILCDDGGTLLGQAVEAPIGAEGLARLAIGPLIGTMVDTLYWQLGTDPGMSTPSNRYSDVYSHRTEVAPRWGADRETFETSGDWRIYENTKQLIEEGTDPPAVVIDHGHRAGLKVFLSMRVNDIHDGQLEGDVPAVLSPTKKEHKEWLLGAVEDATTPHKYRGLSRFAYNFALGDVRDYKLALANEAIANYDLDGLDWDFCRFPRFFPEGQAEESADLLTDLMRKIRASLDEKARKVGRRLLLSVRVPPGFKLARAFGMDVKSWMDEGLIDILIAGVVHRNMHRVPVEEFVEAARDTSVRVIVQNLGALWEGRPPSARVIYHEPDYFTTQMCRASAASYWRAGVDGLYLWNNHVIEFFRDSDYDRQPWKEIGDPESIARKDKHYLVDNPFDWDVMTEELGAPSIPPGPLPIALEKPGDSAEVPIDIADDVQAAVADGSLAEATLRLMIVNLSALDEVEFALNDSPLDDASVRRRLLYNDCWLEFDVRGLLRQGWNRVQVGVCARNPHVGAPLKIESVEVIVRYRETGSEVE